MSDRPCPPLAGVILAGGAGQRVDGQDKAWLPWHGLSLFEHTLARLAPQVDSVWVSANRQPERYAAWLARGALQAVVADEWPGTPGPLAGMASLLPRLCARQPESTWILVAPVDTPTLPADLGQRLWQALTAEHAQTGRQPLLAVACTGDQPHWLHMLMHRSLVDDLRASLLAGEQRVHAWCRKHDALRVDFADEAAFANLNRWQDFTATD